jgi:hypothetical protein
MGHFKPFRAMGPMSTHPETDRGCEHGTRDKVSAEPGAGQLEYFVAGAWYIFMRISFCCVFDHSTKGLHHGEEGKEKESQEEEVILTLGVAT